MDAILNGAPMVEAYRLWWLPHNECVSSSLALTATAPDVDAPAC